MIRVPSRIKSWLVAALAGASAPSSAGQPYRGHWFWGAFRGNGWTYGQVVLAATVINVFSLASALFIMTVYDRVIPNNAIESLIALTIGMVIVLTFDFLLKTLRGYFIDVAGQNVDRAVGERLFDKVLTMSMSSRSGSSGAVAGQLREFEALRDFFTSATLVAIVDLPFIILFLFVIWLIGGPIVLAPALAVPFVLLAGGIIQPFLNRLTGRAYEDRQSKQGTLVEALSGLETIKSVAAGDMMRHRWSKAVADQTQTATQGRFLSQFAINAASLAQQAAQVGIVVFGVFLVTAGQLSMGALIACVILCSRTLAPLAQLANVLSRANHAWTAYRRIGALMGSEDEGAGPTVYLKRTALEGRIEFRDVAFSYPGQSAPALSDVNFIVQPGEKVAVLGRTGSGKSTVVRLIVGLYEPSSGAVMIDDTDVRQIDPADLRRAIGSVLQDVHLFSGTVRENIALDRPDVTDEDILRAAKISGVHDFIGGMPQGYGLVLKERGEGLSGGQRQALCMARALVASPDILILDEPTSMMDVASELQLIERLRWEIKDRTLLAVTHRGSMMKLVDRAIVLDRGKVVADGAKDRVLASLQRSVKGAET